MTSTIDGVLFTETLCGDAYNARRSTLVNNCRTAGDASDEACTSVVITTDATANQKALDCVLDAFAEGCDTNDDVKNVVEKTDDTVEPIVDTRNAIVADCRGLADFATNSRCSGAIKTTCAGDPFTQTTGASPTDFCDSASRDDFVTRCTDSDENNNDGCTTVNVSGTATLVTVANCVSNPYGNPCSDDAFNGLRTDRYNHCIGASPTLSCTLVETNVICVADAAKTNTRANPFHAICRNAGTLYQRTNPFLRRTDE